MTTEAAIREIVSEVLRERFAELGLVNFDVDFEEDFDGDKIVRITAHFDRREDLGESLYDAADTIRLQLIDEGDDRFVFVRRDDPGSPDELEADEDTERTQTP